VKEGISINQENLKTYHLNGIYQEIAEICSIETAEEIFQLFKGQQITFPTRLISREYIESQLSELYDGKNLKYLAKQFNYTERWLRQILRDCKPSTASTVLKDKAIN
jgi:Mor family transcriptional regulator